ncbi:MAG: alpha-galactosidase [Candidatus Zhuqueibacterota bacterium]
MKKNTIPLVLLSLLFTFFYCHVIFAITKPEKKRNAPPNEPCTIEQDDSSFVFKYDDTLLLKAVIEGAGANPGYITITETEDGATNQVVKWSSFGKPIKLTGFILGSDEAFPCESDRKSIGPDIVRHSMGLSRSRLNRAVYDRHSDWVLSVDFPASVEIVPEAGIPNSTLFKITIIGQDIILRFRPHYYHIHRGFDFFQPWTYRVWQKPVAGWCSWFAYFQNINERDVRYTADVLSEVLAPFGLTYLQIDDGYQRNPAGMPETWIFPNEKFPSGLNQLSQYITERGLKPGIWTYTAFLQGDIAKAKKDYFVLNDKGEPAFGKWVGFIMDGSNTATLDSIIRPLYRGLRQQGWQYYKVDALRHLRYEGYNSYSDYFEKKKIDRVATYRQTVQAIRDEIGYDNFMLGCWGIRPELMGILDGCRIGGDGFGYAGLAQYNSFNNVIWRNDPDHIELTQEEAWRSTTVTSLTGSLFMLTDKPDMYRSERVEPAKRCLPVPFTLPGQIFDVDPTRSDALHLIDSEMSGDDIRPFDADRNPRCFLYLLEINKPFENWVVLGRTGGETNQVRFYDLGLPHDREYFVFEFWTKTLLGSFSGSFSMGEMDTRFNCQLFCIRERLPKPQILATNRHITCGGIDLESVNWQNNVLEAESAMVANDIYSVYMSEPRGFKLKNVTCETAEILDAKIYGMVRVIRLKSQTSQVVKWRLEY